MPTPSQSQREQALKNGHSFQSRHFDDELCWLCGQPKRDVLHATDFLVYSDIMIGIQRYLKNQQEALDNIEHHKSYIYDWKRTVDGQDVSIFPEELRSGRHFAPAGLFLDFAAPGDYSRKGPLTRYNLSFLPEKLQTFNQYGLFRGDILIPKHLGSVDLERARWDALRAHAGDFPPCA